MFDDYVYTILSTQLSAGFYFMPLKGIDASSLPSKYMKDDHNTR